VVQDGAFIVADDAQSVQVGQRALGAEGRQEQCGGAVEGEGVQLGEIVRPRSGTVDTRQTSVS
jgi:hypothetical protein